MFSGPAAAISSRCRNKEPCLVQFLLNLIDTINYCLQLTQTSIPPGSSIGKDKKNIYIKINAVKHLNKAFTGSALV